MIKRVEIITILLWMLLSAAGAYADQTGWRGGYEYGEERFAVECADFRSDHEGLHVLEIYYKIFYNALSYQKTAEGYEAAYEVTVIVEGQSGNQIEGIIREGDIKVKTYAETQRTTDFVINLLRVPFNEQDISVRISLLDKLTRQSREVKRELKKRSYWNKYPTVSRIEFSREISPANKKSKFNKGETRVIPNVTRLFGGDKDSLLTFYLEVYPGRTDVKYAKVITRLYHRTKGYIYADTIKYGEIDEVKHEVRTINVADLMPGDYELEVRLEGRRNKKYDELKEMIELELTAETMYKNDYEVTVEMLKYMATGEEREKLKKAKTPEERRAAWDEFWRLRAADRHEAENPTKQEYFRRIRHSNRFFSIMKKDGWKTSRGMIYITYGEPDEVDDHPFELATKPYQIWIYFRISPPRKFLFIDEWGDGAYELQPPFNGIGL